MNKWNEILIFAFIIIGVLTGIAYLSFKQIDFIGNKDHAIIKVNQERRDNILLEAEYRNGVDYFAITLLDSVNIEINIGDASGLTFITKNYKLSGDSISIIDEINFDNQYLNSSEMIIQKDRVLYLINETGDFDTIQTMKVKLNKLS